jgi:hypothetical protein
VNGSNSARVTINGLTAGGKRFASSRMTMAAFGLLLITVAGPVAWPQDPKPDSKWKWNISAGYSHLSIDPHLPRDLRFHENHPDDTFLVGSPGETDLKNVVVDTFDIEAGFAYEPMFRNFDILASYVAKIPVQESGRLERQQANDPRPPAIGSFIYSQLNQASVGHVFRPGIGLKFRLSEKLRLWLEAQGLVDFGRWDMTFEKGWSRYDMDQPAITSKATGFYLSPKGRVVLGTKKWSLYLLAGYAQIRFNHDIPNLESHTAYGHDLGFGARFAF